MQDDIELVREKTDIVDIIRQYTSLAQTGNNFKGLCPFHAEKTPSFFVRPDKGMYFCFGCQRGGDIYSFIMEKENLSFGEALEVLAKKAHVPLTQNRDPSRGEKKERIFRMLTEAQELFEKSLHGDAGKIGRDYLLQRKLTNDTITSFQLGFAINSWDNLSTLLNKKGYRPEELVEAGLAILSSKSPARPYDRFRNRIMFPIQDHLGRIVGFSGRTLDVSEQAKYVNSPETIVFTKGNVLYGYHKAQRVIKEKGYAILVEGNIDVVSFHQAGITNTVAPLGTGLTAQQLKLLKRITSRILILFDADDAGKKASLRAAIEAVQEGFEIKIATLTVGKDPDEASKDLIQLKKDLSQSKDAYTYFLKHAQHLYPGQSSYDTKKITEFVFPLIYAISDNSIKEKTLELLSRDLSLPYTSVSKDFSVWKTTNSNSVSSVPDETKINNIPYKKNRQELLEEHLLALLLNVDTAFIDRPEVRTLIASLSQNVFTQKIYRDIFLKIQTLLANGETHLTDTIQFSAETIGDLEKTLLFKDFGLLLQNQENAKDELQKTIYALKQAYFKKEIKELVRESDKLSETPSKRREVQEKIRQLTEQLREIER